MKPYHLAILPVVVRISSIQLQDVQTLRSILFNMISCSSSIYLVFAWGIRYSSRSGFYYQNLSFCAYEKEALIAASNLLLYKS